MNLTGVVNAQIITITVHNATDVNGQVLPDTDVRMGVLLGDVTADALVNDDDLLTTSSHSSEMANATNFRSDVNTNGVISAADIALVRSKLGTNLPGVTIVPDPNTQLLFSGPTTIDLSVSTTFTVSVSVTFSGYNSRGLSYWMEAENDLAPFIKINNATYFTFLTPNQTGPITPFASTFGATSGFMTEVRDVGATGTLIAAGTYHVTDLTFCLDPNTPNGPYALQWTTRGPHFSEVTDENGHAHFMAPATAFTFTVMGAGPPPPPPPCGVISGTITDPQGPLEGAVVQACYLNSPAPTCFADIPSCLLNATTNASGDYQITGVMLNTPINLTVFPPPGSLDFPRGQNLTVSSCAPLTGQDVMLPGPPPPFPPGADIEPYTYGAGGVPVVNSSQTLTLTALGCTDGTASYTITGSATITGSMTETPVGSGTYQATVLPLSPAHGAATVTMTIDCPGPGTETIVFDMYIDPSGIVQDSHGTRLPGATVTLLRSDTAFGPFTVVPDGSAVMSPANRTNPDLTDAQGHFGWDVLAGFYKVRTEKPDCTVVETGAIPIPPPVTDLVLTLDCSAPEVTSAVSRKTHGGAGPFDIAMPLSGTTGVECRTTGGTNDYTLVATFATNVTVTGSPQGEVTSGTGCVGIGGGCTANVSVSGNVVTIPLTNIANVQTINVRLNGVNGASDAPAADIDIPMSILWGDTNGNRSVNAADVSQTKARSGQAVDGTNFRSDVNANGSLNAGDVALCKQYSGTGLPPQ